MSLRARLILALLAMALLPTLAFTLYTRYQIGIASQWWMLPGIQRTLESSIEVSRGAMVRMDAAALAQADRWAADCPLPRPKPPELASLRREIGEAGLDMLQVYRHGRQWHLESQFAPERVLQPDRPDFSADLDSVLAGGGSLHSARGWLAGVARGPNGCAVLCGFRVAPGFFEDIDRIGRGTEYYRGHSVVADIQRQYAWMLATALVLVLVALALIVSARLAGEMSRPLRELSEALGRIAAGEWSARVEPQGAPEMRRLGESFNAMAARLEAARDALARAEREAAWRDVAQRLAHEFKNILTPMSLSLYVLAKNAAAAESSATETEESLGALERGVAHLSRLAGQFSQYARLPEPRFEPLDLVELARGTAQNAPGAKVEIHADGPVEVVGDSLLLARAVHNLVLNACEASSAGGIVEVAAWIEGDRAVLEVRDRGTGIPEGLEARLFRPYVSTKKRGSGLGLALVRDIAEQHGGSVGLANREGGGAVARLVVPRDRAAAADPPRET
ncbi:MAG TPA: HAMP domain-containing sensor histidine kinase [Candidatus Udaeobacter sp.]|nr:HAMP domain-containing sensor histidine kinase [Candidatus Udaeobacter sp.]